MFSGPVGPKNVDEPPVTDFLLANQGIVIPRTDGLPAGGFDGTHYGFPFGQARTYSTLTVKIVNPIDNGDAIAVALLKNGVQVGAAALFTGPTAGGDKLVIALPPTTYSAPAGVPDEMNVRVSVLFASDITVAYVLATVQ